MFCGEEKMRIEVRENGDFVKSLLGGSNKVMARAVLRGQNERTLRDYCRVLQVKGLSKLRKEGLIEAILSFAEENGYLAGVTNAVELISTENKPACFVKSTAVEADIQAKMKAVQANYQYAGYVAGLVKFCEQFTAEAITPLQSVKDVYAFSPVPVIAGVPEPEVIDVEAVEVKKYPAEICYKRGCTWPHAWIRTQQIKMFPSAFMRDESNLICNGFRG